MGQTNDRIISIERGRCRQDITLVKGGGIKEEGGIGKVRRRRAEEASGVAEEVLLVATTPTGSD